jgi:hypothetical protein
LLKSLGALHLKHSILLAKLCSLQPNLVQIQSPDFHPDRPPPLPNMLMLLAVERGKSQQSKLPPPEESMSLNAPHLKQLERLAKLCVPQFPALQYQSPGRTSEPVNPNELEAALPPKTLPKSTPDFDSPQRWQESRLWKFQCWHDLQFQSPGLFMFYL